MTSAKQAAGLMCHWKLQGGPLFLLFLITSCCDALPARRKLATSPPGPSFNYGAALSKCLFFIEAQRSGQLPANRKVSWRGNSALLDGSDAKTNLVGGYYIGGDNVKYTFPMAYSITMLAWAAIDYKQHLVRTGQYESMLEAIKWGTDYLLKANPSNDTLFVMVGNPASDHACWMRPEDMTTSRKSYAVGGSVCGSDVAAEVAAAMAAASKVFAARDPIYAQLLISRARLLFRFAATCQGKYSDAVPDVNPFYTSSGYYDELLWGAAWLYRATGIFSYFNYLFKYDRVYKWSEVSAVESSWDDKNAAAQVLIAGILFRRYYRPFQQYHDFFNQFRYQADNYVCAQMPHFSKVAISRGGHIYVRPDNNQYVTSAAFLLILYADYLRVYNLPGVTCNSTVGTRVVVAPGAMVAFAKRQLDYILGDNPLGVSYMVGFGGSSVWHAHHRASSLPSITSHPQQIGCAEGFAVGFGRKGGNFNYLQGAIVGGADAFDQFTDDRSLFETDQPALHTNAPAVGAFVRLYAGYIPPWRPLFMPPPAPPSPPAPPFPPFPTPSPPSPALPPPAPAPPPPFTGLLASVKCLATSSWLELGTTPTSQFSCNVTNVGSRYTISGIVLRGIGFTPSKVWNAEWQGNGVIALPAWATLGPGQAATFGFVQAMPAKAPSPAFVVIYYLSNAPPSAPSAQTTPKLAPLKPKKSPQAPRKSPSKKTPSPKKKQPRRSPPPPKKHAAFMADVAASMADVTARVIDITCSIVESTRDVSHVSCSLSNASKTHGLANIRLRCLGFSPKKTWNIRPSKDGTCSLPSSKDSPLRPGGSLQFEFLYPAKGDTPKFRVLDFDLLGP